MTRFDPGFHIASTVLLISLMLVVGAAAGSQIEMLQATATLSSASREKPWSAPVKSTGGPVLYVLSLEPDFDTHQHVVTVELVPQRPDAKPDSPNLPDPTGRWHGLQPYHFVGADLAQGIDKSVFGAKRTISLNKLGVVVEMTVSKAEVSPIPAGDYQIDSLEVHVTVHNLNR